jgi:ribA/ribD-fused uncharacterized protein
MQALVKHPTFRTYNRLECIAFRKTAEVFGGLSNMAGGYPLNVNGVKILTSEALYQACRFPHLPNVQRLIIAERSPMTAKMVSKPYRDNSRVDWDIIRTRIMRWCLQIKLVQNWDKFSRLLLETGDLPIVEDSRKDAFWGAKPVDETNLVGANALGRLLMQLREQIINKEITCDSIISPLQIPDFLLYEQSIGFISASGECQLERNIDLLSFDEVDKKIDLDIILVDSVIDELSCSDNNALNYTLNEEEGKPVVSKNDRYNVFNIILPYIVESLVAVERTDKELAELLDVPLALVRSWLSQGVVMGKIKKLSRPVRYVATYQLVLID